MAGNTGHGSPALSEVAGVPSLAGRFPARGSPSAAARRRLAC